MDETDIKRIELLTLDVKPGQVLVFKIPFTSHPDNVKLFCENLRTTLPGVPILLIASDVVIEVIDRSTIPGA